MRQTAGHCLCHIAMTVGKERASQITLAQSGGTQLRLGHQPARVRQRIGICQDAAFQVAPAIDLWRAPAGADQVGLVQGLALVYGHGQQLQLRLVAHIGVAANPRRIELIRKKKIENSLVRLARRKNHGQADAQRQVFAPARQERSLIRQDHRRQADAQPRRSRAGARADQRQTQRGPTSNNTPASHQRSR